MKFSRSFIPTLRQAPTEAEIVSYQLLIRAGMIRKVAMGIFELLPLGVKSLRKVISIVRNELDQAGCQEVEMPHLIPAELWQESGRWQKYGKELLRITDRHDREYCFGPTHEEVICDMVRKELQSYRSLPLNLYQIQTKFRDEIRPRFGLMRGREFLMKDGYSFHASEEDLDREYELMKSTYSRIFKKCGVESCAVEADTGNIGGSASHEFMMFAETGEDTIVRCDCGYTANLEKATSMNASAPTNAVQELQPLQKVATPQQKSIEQVAKFLKVDPAQTIKTLVYKVDQKFIVVCLAGHREVNEIKLLRFLNGQELRLASDDEIQNLSMPVGFLGPIGLTTTCRVLFDYSALNIVNAVTGANEVDYHLINVNIKRDFTVSAENSADLTNVLAGDVCPKCQTQKLTLARGIEVGHIFKLGTRYSQPMKVCYLNEQGQEQPAIMGTYGIGVTRVWAASIEQNHDSFGIIWPKNLAPYQIHLITMGPEPELVAAADQVYHQLLEQNFEVLWDDRAERAGVKLNDADLIGNPLQIIIGRKSLENKSVEFKIRKTGEKGLIPMADLTNVIKSLWDKI